MWERPGRLVGAFLYFSQRMGGPYDERAHAVAVGNLGVYVTGYFRSQPATFGSLSLTSAGVEDLFIAKLTDTGTSAGFTWVQRVGGFDFESGQALAVNGPNVYVGGYCDSGTFGTTTVPPGNTKLFVAKLVDAGPTGAFVWPKTTGGSGYNAVNSLALSGSSVYMAGFFTGSAAFGATTLTSAGGYDAVVAKLVDAGSTADFVWAQRAGGNGYDQAFGVATNGASVYAAGSFEGSAATFGSTVLSSAGQNDAFVAKLTDAGPAASFGWVQRMGGAGQEVAHAVVAAGSNLCVAGEFRSAALVCGATTLANAGSTDLFVARLIDAGAAGTFAWAQAAGGPNSDQALALALAPGGQLYVAGFVQPPGSFGAWPAYGLPNSSVGAFASIIDATLTATTAPLRSESIGLFPNPAHGRATVQLPTIPGTPTATLAVLDALGRTLRTQTAATNARTDLDLTGLAPGLYALRIQVGAAIATRRLVVE